MLQMNDFKNETCRKAANFINRIPTFGEISTKLKNDLFWFVIGAATSCTRAR